MRSAVSTALASLLWMSLPQMLAGSSVAWGANTAQNSKSAKAYAHHEALGRGIDDVALEGKRAAMTTLLPALKSARGTADEPRIFIKIIELQQDEIELIFRIANGKAVQEHKSPDLAPYLTALRNSAQWCSDFLTRFPKNSEASRALYLRAKSWNGAGDKAKAIADFTDYVARFPHAREWRISTYALGDLLANEKQFAPALSYLSRLTGGDVQDTFSTMALDRIASIYYIQDDIPSGLRYLELELKELRARKQLSPTVSAYQQEKVLSSMTLYYVTALEKGKPGFDVLQAFKYLASMASRSQLGKASIHFAMLLRTKGMSESLQTLKAAALNGPILRSDALELSTVVLEYQFERRFYSDLSKTAEEMRTLAETCFTEKTDPVEKAAREKRIAKFRSTLEAGAEGLQVSFVKDKEGAESLTIAKTLENLYSVLLDIPGSDSNTLAKVRFNLGEIKFQLKEFAQAVPHYRWVVENAPKSKNPEVRKLSETAALRAIAARYEQFRLAERFPKNLKTVSISAPAQSEAQEKVSKLDPETQEWIVWLDEYASKFGAGHPVDAYSFEANRMVYAQGQARMAVERLSKFVKTIPTSSYAIASASLVIDTYVASSDWDQVFVTAKSFSSLQGWRDPAFVKKLGEIESEAAYKRIEGIYQAKDYDKALHQTDDYLKNYPQGNFHEDALALAASCALALQNKRLALTYFDRFEAEHGKSSKSGGKSSTLDLSASARLTAAAVAEQDYDHAKASREMLRYISLPESSRASQSVTLGEGRKKALLLAWASGDTELLKTTLSTPHLCEGGKLPECTQFSLYLRLSSNSTQVDPNAGENALLTSAIKLQQSRLTLRDRLTLLDTIASEWGSRNPLLTYPLTPMLSELIPEALKRAREQASKIGALELDKVRIKRRAKLVSEIEKTGATLAQLPFARVRAAVLNELADLYLDFSKDLKSLRAPRGLDKASRDAYRASIDEVRAPFDAKSAEYRFRALALASDSGIELATYSRIQQSMPPQGTRKPEEPAPAAPEISSSPGPATAKVDDTLPQSVIESMASQYQPLTHPFDLNAATQSLSRLIARDEKNPFRVKLHEAIHAHHIATLTEFVDDAEKGSLLSKLEIRAVRAINRVLAGARAEAWSELTEAEAFATEKADRARLDLIQLAAFYETRNLLRTRGLVRSLTELGNSAVRHAEPGPVETETLTLAKEWLSHLPPEAPKETKLGSKAAAPEVRNPASNANVNGSAESKPDSNPTQSDSGAKSQ